MTTRTRKTSSTTGRTTTIVAAAAVAALVGGGSAVAAKQITSYDIKDGTIQTRDLTTNNFARFTATENVVSATTPAGANGQVVDVPASTDAAPTTALVTIVLDQGTWQLDGTAQFFHVAEGARPSGTDLGVVTIAGLQDGFAKAFTADVPDDGVNGAQTSFSGTIKIAANDTPVVISGAFTDGNSGRAGVSVQATQYEYVAQPAS